MSKWKAPENFGTGCSIGGRWLEVVDGILTIDDSEGLDYGTPLSSLGFTQLLEDVEQTAQAANRCRKRAGDASLDAGEVEASEQENGSGEASELSQAGAHKQAQSDMVGDGPVDLADDVPAHAGEASKASEKEAPSAAPKVKVKKG